MKFHSLFVSGRIQVYHIHDLHVRVSFLPAVMSYSYVSLVSCRTLLKTLLTALVVSLNVFIVTCLVLSLYFHTHIVMSHITSSLSCFSHKTFSTPLLNAIVSFIFSCTPSTTRSRSSLRLNPLQLLVVNSRFRTFPLYRCSNLITLHDYT